MFCVAQVEEFISCMVLLAGSVNLMLISPIKLCVKFTPTFTSLITTLLVTFKVEETPAGLLSGIAIGAPEYAVVLQLCL